MAKTSKINTKATTQINTGFGINTSDYGGRFINKNGLPNIEKRGIDYFGRISWYHTMQQMPRWKFLCILFLFYFGMNFLFAIVYIIIGINHLQGIMADSMLGKFGEAYFFSAQTFTTVGYGRISPKGFATSAVAAFEALIGLLSFALATGLFYGRFSKPKAFVRFSNNAVLAPFNNGLAIMMRVASYKNNNLIDVEAKVIVGIIMEENGLPKNKFFSLELEYEKVNSLTLSWTIVHPITENSPFYKFTAEDFAHAKGEVLIFFKAFDDMFSNTVAARTSYTLQELVVGAKFEPMYHRDKERNTTILELDKLNSYIATDISKLWQSEKKEESI
ncbi:ion channel [Ferruginibacter sp.]|uniref:ion channel n=1 Tax=Ferruginibacter sp. TaxID=1940288 RepID=UPI0026588941|nr:ion channel [Ferruginibacter sp.]